MSLLKYFFLIGISINLCSCDETISNVEKCAINTGIPSLNISLNYPLKSVNKVKYTNGNLSWANTNDCETESIKIGIKGRGNTSWSFPKKSYTLKIENGPQSLFDFPATEKYVLIANYSDKTLLRNKLAFKLSEISHLNWTPVNKSIAVYINNEYQGIYLLVQKIETGRHAIQDPSTVILEVDQLERLHNDDIFFETTKHLFCIKSSISDTVEFINNIKEQLARGEKAILEAAHSNIYQKFYDINTVVDWYIINEIAKNNDALFNSSVYFNLKPNDKIRMGPLWDYDIAFGNINYNGNDSIEGFFVRDSPYFTALFQNSSFIHQLKKRYLYFYNLKQYLLDTIDEWANNLNLEVEKNFTKWPILGKYVWPNSKVHQTYDEEIEYLKNWLSQRMDWLYHAINEL